MGQHAGFAGLQGLRFFIGGRAMFFWILKYDDGVAWPAWTPIRLELPDVET
jgi:hypothetical protein